MSDKAIFTLPDLRQRISVLWSTGLLRGDSTGWQCVDELYTVAPGQFTIVTGWPGSGKSEWVDALALNLIRQDWRFAVYSPENRPIALHGIKLIEKWVGKPFRPGPTPRMSHVEADEAGAEIGNAFGWLEPPGLDNLAIDAICEGADEYFSRFAGQKIKRGLIVDPWNELDHSRIKDLTETEYISQALSYVRNWARATNTHVWIVAHPAKQRRENGELPIPRPDMIAGSQHWWNKADNAITVYRDYQRDDGQIQVYLQKVRFKHIGKLGCAELVYDKVTGRYDEPQRDESGRQYVYSDAGAR